jgi:hypothetical protein
MAKIELCGGRPAIVIDGRVCPPSFVTVRTRDNGGKDIHFDGSYFESLGKAGIRVFFLHCNTLWLQPDAIELFDREARALFEAVPDAYIMPGFIDTHIHGGQGFDASRATCNESSIQAMSQLLASRGVTGFVPTVVSMQPEAMLRNIARLAEVINEPMPGAEPVGIHLEGPFINPQKRGAQNSTSIVAIDLGYARELIAAGAGKIRRITFAPELQNAEKLVELLCENNILPSMGHSVANEEETLRAIDAGARCRARRNLEQLSAQHPPPLWRDGVAGAVAQTRPHRSQLSGLKRSKRR